MTNYVNQRKSTNCGNRKDTVVEDIKEVSVTIVEKINQTNQNIAFHSSKRGNIPFPFCDLLPFSKLAYKYTERVVMTSRQNQRKTTNCGNRKDNVVEDINEVSVTFTERKNQKNQNIACHSSKRRNTYMLYICFVKVLCNKENNMLKSK